MLLQILFFILGLAVGSFLNVVIFRFPEMKGILSGRSKCPRCKKPIAAYDLIPILSFLLLWGRCRYCRKRISLQYPIVELTTGLLFLAFARVFGLSWMLVTYLIIGALSILIFVSDVKYLEIPEVFSWLLLIMAMIAAIVSGTFSLSSFLLCGLVGGGILGILVGISDERWMGSGDIKIGLAFGFLFGFYKALLFLFLAFVIGALVGILLMIVKKKGMKSEIAFSPFLIIAAIVAIFWGDYLVNLYLKFVIM